MTGVLAGLLDALVVDPPHSYCWLGQRFRTPDAAGALVDALADRLYGDFYVTGAPAPPVHAPERPRGPWPSADVFALRHANTGRGSPQSGWVVDATDADVVIIRRPGLLRLHAHRHEVRTRSWPPAIGDEVVLIRPPETLGRPAGFYTAFGDAGEGTGADALDRFYWNVRPSGRASLIAVLTGTLNRAALPFRLKVLNDRGTLRCDAAVLYAASDLRPAVAQLLGGVWPEVAGLLDDAVPALALRLGPGLAFAEDPGGDESFGTHRCRLLAEALVSASGRGAASSSERTTAIAQVFSEAGLSLEHPHLRPGSRSDRDPVIQCA